jgi:hypothetical protein
MGMFVWYLFGYLASMGNRLKSGFLEIGHLNVPVVWSLHIPRYKTHLPKNCLVPRHGLHFVPRHPLQFWGWNLGLHSSELPSSSMPSLLTLLRVRGTRESVKDV